MKTLTPYDLITKGTRLVDIKNQPGWQDVTDILDSILEEATKDLLLCEADKPDTILALHAQARAAKITQALLLSRIDETIDNARQTKQELTQQNQ
jgi:hypothetical protein